MMLVQRRAFGMVLQDTWLFHGTIRENIVYGRLDATEEELQAAATKLESDFYAWDDGQYRDRVIKPAWDRTLRELEDARRELAEAEKDLSDLPEKARRAGALPGWIRE